MSLQQSPRTLPDWLAHLERLHPKGQAGIELGLDRVRQVKEALGQRETCPVIIVAGTNGKGSTCAYLESILDRTGCKVGCYTSPHLVHYNERVRVNQRPVDDLALCRAFERVEVARGDVALTYFEFGTLAAWEVFAEARVDVAVMEVGLGGRLDAVNVYEPDVSVVTGVALDHMDYLGPTRETIGLEKAGIFRAGKAAICADRDPPASLVEYAGKLGAKLQRIGHDFDAVGDPYDSAQWRYWLKREGADEISRNFPYPGLRGPVQIINVAAALAALDGLRDKLPVSMQSIREGLVDVVLPGRFQVLPGRPVVVLDVAHNSQACAILAGNLGRMGYFPKTLAIVGMLADKDIVAALMPVASQVDHWLTVTLPPPRGASAVDVAAAIRGIAPHASYECFPSVVEATHRAAMLLDEADRIVTFGSFQTVGAMLVDADILDRLRRVP